MPFSMSFMIICLSFVIWTLCAFYITCIHNICIQDLKWKEKPNLIRMGTKFSLHLNIRTKSIQKSYITTWYISIALRLKRDDSCCLELVTTPTQMHLSRLHFHLKISSPSTNCSMRINIVQFLLTVMNSNT